MASGALSTGTVTSTSINVNYAFSGCGYVHLCKGSSCSSVGFGSGSGSKTFTGLSPDTNYTFTLKDNYAPGFWRTLASKTIKTKSESSPPPPPPSPSGTLSGQATGAETASLNYSYANGTNVSLFRGSDLLKTFGSGSGSGVYEDSGLDPETQYTYYLRNGTSTGSTLLAQATINTPELPAEGTLSAQTVDSGTIDLTYSFHDGEDVSLFRDGERIKTFGSGSGSGIYRNTGLSANTSYSYALRNGTSSSDLLLASASAKTLKAARQSIIEQGKILPLSSQLHIFDSTLTKMGIIEDYQYLYWNYKYRKPGNFKLIINRYKQNTEYLIKGNILALYIAGYYRAGVIESIEIGLTEEGKISENYTIIGRELGGLLMERPALNNIIGEESSGYDSQNTYAETAMRHYVNVNCMDATDTDRNYPLLYLDINQERGGTVKYDARFQLISELLEELSLASGLGWEVVLDPENKRMVFRIIEGLDRSFGNGVNPTVMFSPEYGNVKLISFTDSNLNTKNVAYVAGQGEANLRTIQKVTKDGETYTGMNRREFVIDARDLDEEAKLIQRGNERLAEAGEEMILVIENLSTGPFSYGKDFYLGDIITAEYPDIVKADLRLIESIIEITDKDGIRNKLIFGKSSPDIALQKLLKNVNPEIRR